MTGGEPVRIVIADDQAMVRAGLATLLDSQPGLTVVGQAGTGEEAVQLARKVAPDVVLMDIRMPVLNGLAATRRILSAARGARRPAGPGRRADHLRPGRVRVRGAARGRVRLPAQARAPGGTAARRAGGRRRRGAAFPAGDPQAGGGVRGPAARRPAAAAGTGPAHPARAGSTRPGHLRPVQHRDRRARWSCRRAP